MTDLALDQSGDLVVDPDFALVTGRDSVVQRIRLRLYLVRGSWYLDTSEGVPWFQTIMVKAPDVPAIDALLRAEIASVPGVDSLVSFESSFDNEVRTYTATFRVEVAGDVVPSSFTLGESGDVLGVIGV